jgi:tetratricopeptide (TPR) repeat protein
MTLEIDLSRISELSVVALESWLATTLEDGNGVSPLELYNAFIPVVRVAPSAAMERVQATLSFFQRHGDETGELVFLELVARIHLYSGHTEKAQTCIEQIMDQGSEDAEAVVLELAEDMVKGAGDIGTSKDHLPCLVKLAQLVYGRYDKHSELANLYLRASALYSRHGATQAAYRCLADAEEVAHRLQSLPLIAECYAVAVVVSCEEHDYRFAIGAARLALSAYRQAEIDPPPVLFSNMGVALMNCQQLWRATVVFQRGLRIAEGSDSVASGIRINLAACLRRRNRLSEAESELAKVDADRLMPEFKLEYALNCAMLAVAREKTEPLIEQLKAAANALNELLASALRLHHRRGLRERYIVRVEALLHAVSDRGTAEDMLVPVLAVRGNAMADWLAILSWQAELKLDTRCSAETTIAVDDAVRRIRALGAPHLFGYHEKYDDPWEAGNFGKPWDDLSEICTDLRRRKLPLPLEQATLERHRALCIEALQSGHCLMAMTYAGADALLWCFLGSHYQRVALPLAALREWHRATLRYAQHPNDRRAFVSALRRLSDTLAPLLDPIFGSIERAIATSIRFIEDFSCELPLMEFALRNAELEKRMAEGAFHIRMVPAVVAAEVEQPGCSGVAIMTRGGGDLLLPAHEGLAFSRAAGLPPPVNVDARAGIDLKSSLVGREVLIVSTHGHSIASYRDPYLASLGVTTEDGALRVSSLQSEAPDLPLRLVMLNTCYSGSRSARNFHKSFRTSDSVAFPNLFLLNRRAVAVGSAWRSSDTAGFVLSHLIGEGIGLRLQPSAAIGRAIALLRRLTRSQTAAILATIEDETVRASASDRIRFAPENGMFSEPYFTAGISIHGLM